MSFLMVDSLPPFPSPPSANNAPNLTDFAARGDRNRASYDGASSERELRSPVSRPFTKLSFTFAWSPIFGKHVCLGFVRLPPSVEPFDSSLLSTFKMAFASALMYLISCSFIHHGQESTVG